MTVFENWSEELDQGFRQKVISGSHNLHKRPEFQRGALIELLDSIDPEFLSIFTHGNSGNDITWSLVDRAGFTGEQIFQALETGCIWIVLRRIHLVNATLAQLASDIESSITAIRPELNARKWHHKILLSSPGVLVPYHVDPMENFLWHIDGPKQFLSYPGTTEFLPNDALEAILLQQQHEEVPYNPDFESSAAVYDLQPGQFLSWPQYTPHRVINGTGMNISMTTEYFTPESQIRSGAMFFNGLTRKHLNANPERVTRIGTMERVKWAAAKVLRTAKAHRPIVQDTPKEFQLDLSAPRCVHKLA